MEKDSGVLYWLYNTYDNTGKLKPIVRLHATRRTPPDYWQTIPMDW